MKVAVTGHRPTKLFGINPYSMENYNVLLKFAKETLANANKDTTTVLTGMALGWDMAIAEACADLGIPFIAYVPCRGQEKAWKGVHWQAKYLALLALAQEVKILAEVYTPQCMRDRNIAMANDCDVLIALWNGDNYGGTAHCVKYFQETQSHKRWYNYWHRWTTYGGQ